MRTHRPAVRLALVAVAVGAMTGRFVVAGHDAGVQGRGAIEARELAMQKLAGPEAGRRILTRLQTLSAPFGTTIAIDGATGVIRPAPPRTTP